MILVEIVKLIVDVNWAWDFLSDLVELDQTVFFGPNFVLAKIVISLFHFNDLIRHDVEHHADRQEHNTKDTESEHSAHGSWHRPPRRQSLLLELALLEPLNLLSDFLLVAFRDVHKFK